MTLDLNSDLNLGLPEFDDQQKEFFVRVDTFSDKIEKEHGNKAVAEFIDFLDQFAHDHFKHEEHLQMKTGFPGREEHLTAHNEFIDLLKDFRARISAGEDSKKISLAVKGMMVRWIIKHTRHMDREFTDYLLDVSEKIEQESTRKKLGEILVESHFVSPATLERALKKHRESGNMIGKILVEMGVADSKDIDNALLAQAGKSRFTKRLGEIMVESGLISYTTLEHALENQRNNSKLLGAVLVEMGVVDLNEIIDALAIQKGMFKEMN